MKVKLNQIIEFPSDTPKITTGYYLVEKQLLFTGHQNGCARACIGLNKNRACIEGHIWSKEQEDEHLYEVIQEELHLGDIPGLDLIIEITGGQFRGNIAGITRRPKISQKTINRILKVLSLKFPQYAPIARARASSSG